MDKYFAFRRILDFMADHAEVTDANMNYCGSGLMVTGEDDEHTITINVNIKEKESNND